MFGTVFVSFIASSISSFTLKAEGKRKELFGAL